jgi:hypothetical protein
MSVERSLFKELPAAMKILARMARLGKCCTTML